MTKDKGHRKYDPEFKQDAVELAKKIGLSHAAKKLDISLNNLQRWKSQSLPIFKWFKRKTCYLSANFLDFVPHKVCRGQTSTALKQIS